MSLDDTTRLEERGLLRTVSFDLDDVESVEQLKIKTNDLGEIWFGGQRTWKTSTSWPRLRYIFVILALVLGLVVIRSFWVQQSITSHQIPNESVTGIPAPTNHTSAKFKSAKISQNNITYVQSQKYEKPQGFKIIALIFFGRPPVVSILDCYLKKNLISNGGFLDEVHWAVNTNIEADVQYLDQLIQTTELYKKITIPSLNYKSIWEHAVEPDHMYIKIDDDIVYMNDNAIPDLVFTKLNHPDSLNVVGNLVNSPETGWLHYHVGAVHAYLPERKPPAPDREDNSYGPGAWRASALPKWSGNADLIAYPVKGHRWLPLVDNEASLYKTPIAKTEYNAFGPDWKSWDIAAQVHYSLLENIEKNQLSKYHYGSGLDDAREGIWNMGYERMNINFMAIWGKDVVENIPFSIKDDELELSVNLPLKLRRPLLVNTHVIVAHFSFRTQPEVYNTDLLSRYRAYANEMVCTADNQIERP